MALRISLVDAIETERLILFDTSVLISAYDREDDAHVQQIDLLRAVPQSARFTSELVWWQFLQPHHGRQEINRRRKWRQLHGIRIRESHPPGYLSTLISLAGMAQARGDAIDGSLCAYSISSRTAPNGRFAIATADGDDFCWHGQVVVISDFFLGPACQ